MPSITKKYLINGPNNVVRLTNEDKVLYIFGDYHLDTQYQTECIYSDKYESLDIDKFLLLFMKKNNNIKYDIFHEIDEIKYYKNNINNNPFFKEKYIDNISKLFQSNIKNKYTNFKFHYIEIRNNLFLYNIIDNYIKNNFNLMYDSIGKDFILQLTYLKKLITIFKKSLNKNKYIIKILNKYNDKNLKKKFNEIYNIINNYFELIFKKIINLIKYIKLNCYNDIANINNIKNDINININNDIDDLYLLFLDIGVILTDLYFLRRFLDKQYIKNGILYTGLAHMCDISYLLVKYFNYKISHVNYIHDNININNYIIELSNNNLTYITMLSDLLTKRNNNLIYQCTDLIDFPDNFT